MKKMRFTLSFILCIILAVTCCFSASAATYDLNELGMSIEIPDSMIVVTNSELKDSNDTCYLQAVNSDNSLRISIFMVPTDQNAAIQSFLGLSDSTLEEIKDKIEDEGFTAGTIGNYGNVPFLDFSRKDTDANGTDTFIKQSQTVINSMKISVISESTGDNFTSEELILIKGCLDSIEFDSVVQSAKEQKAKNTKKWIISILIICIAAALTVFFVIKVRKLKRQKELIRAKQKSTDYDVLSRAEYRNIPQQTNKVSGYKTSADYFDKAFDNPDTSVTNNPSQKKAPAENTAKTKPGAIKRMGYFAKNLKREVNKSKAKKSKNNNKRKAVDYDIFSEK